MRMVLVAAAAALALPNAATAQRAARPRPPVNCYPFACPPRPIPADLPSEAALALGRRIVSILDGGAVAERTAQLVAVARAREAPRRTPPAYPDGPIRAVPPVDLADYPAWGIVVQQRVIDHGALFYARKYSLAELEAMLAFFESSGGRKFLEERQSRSPELERELATEVLEDDLWNVVCGEPVPQEVENAPHHQFLRLHPPMDYPLPPAPPYCDARGRSEEDGRSGEGG